MTKPIFFLLLLGVIFHFSFSTKASGKKQTVNPILGDVSFIQKFGHEPDAGTDEDLRIRTHLEYVEHVLRQKDVSALPPELRQRRNEILRLLHDYWTNGIFPRNYDHKETRKPCFIDKDSRICAVGYLIEKTAGRQVAENINQNHKYDKIFEMNDKLVDNWIETSGLSKEECAMIQPTYGPTPVYTYNYIKPSYGISSAVLGGMNLSMNTMNAIQISKGANTKTIGVLGLITGAGQTILGAANFPRKTNGFNGDKTNESQKAVSMVNIALGTTTMILSTWNLITNKKHQEKKLSWNINSFETMDNKLGMAFTLTRKL